MHPNPRLPGGVAVGGSGGGRSRGSHGVLARVLPALLVAAVTCSYIWFVTVSLPSAREGGGGGSDVDDDVRGLLRRHRRGGGGGGEGGDEAAELKSYRLKKAATSKKVKRRHEEKEEESEEESEERESSSRRKRRRGGDERGDSSKRQRRRSEDDDGGDSAESADDAASSRGGGSEAEAMDSFSSASSSDDDAVDSADSDDSDSDGEAVVSKHRNDRDKHGNEGTNKKSDKNSLRRRSGGGGYGGAAAAGVDAVADEAALDKLFALYADDDPEDAPSSEDAFYTRGRYRAYWRGSRRAGRVVELFKRYAAFHKKALGGGGGAYETVVVSPVGQLCNRLMTITSGFVLALLTRKVLIVQDTGFYCSMNDLFEEPGFAWLGSGSGGGGGAGGPPHVVSNPPHPPWSDMEPLLCGDLRTAYPGSVLLRMNQYIVPYMAWNPHHRGALRALFGGGGGRRR
eukprot:Rhum_TRINITY_DN2182_c0_g1::Rhum_TRINITY_DN2182_c0_g1_i1::g.6195::m.6195